MWNLTTIGAKRNYINMLFFRPKNCSKKTQQINASKQKVGIYKTTLYICFHFYDSKYLFFIDTPCQNSAKISSGSGEEADFNIFAIFSNSGYLGYLICPNFIILRPWSLIMLHVKFDNNWCYGFREKVVWICLNMLFLDKNCSKKTLVNRK